MKKIVQGQKRFWSLTLAVLLALSLAIPLGTAWAEESTPAPSAVGPTQAAGEQTPTPSQPAPEPSAPAPADGDEAPAETTEAPTATPTPTPEPAPTAPDPTPTATPEPEVTATPATPAVTPTATPEISPAPSLSPEISPTPIPAQWTVQVQAEEENLSAQAEAAAFAVQGDCTGEGEGTATLALALHAQGRALPQGTAAYDAQAGAVTVEGETVLRLFGLPAGASVSVESASEDALRLRIEIPAASFALRAEAVLPALTGEGEGALTLAAELGGVQAQAQASLAAQEAAAQVLEWAGALTVPLTWADNDDAKGLRPDAETYPAPSLLVSIDGGEAHAPTAEDETLLGLAALPEVEVAQDLSALAVTAGTLPARTALDGAEHTMVWSIAPAPVESYALEQTEAGYTYRLVGDVEIATEAYAGALYASAAFLDFDNALETRPEGAALQASLLVAIDGGAAHAPAEADLALLGIASLPEVSSAWTAAGVTFSVPGDVLPARVLHTAADGTQTAHTAVWTIQPPEIEGYTLLPGISTMRAGDGASAWVYEIQYEEKTIIETEKTEYWAAIFQAVFWADNKDEAWMRPGETFYTLRVSMTGLEQMEGDEIPETPADGDFSDFAPLTNGDLAELGLNAMPKISYNAATGIVSIADNVLPETLVYKDVHGDTFVRHVKWELRPKTVPGYKLREVTKEEIEEGSYTSIDAPGWYYVLLTDVEFDIRVNAAAISDLANYEKLTEAIQNYFRLSVSVDGEVVRDETLADLAADAQVTIDGTTPGNNTGSLTISDTWKYNLDGTPIVYTVHSSDGLLSEKLEGVLEAGDRLEVNFDNTNAPNYGSDTSTLHPGGELVITLKGETDYNAKKQWLDEGEKEDRPQVTYELWRYREGQGYDTAAPVRDGEGDIIELTEGVDGLLSYGTAGSMLDKYDAEGYRYIYVVREYMTGGTVQYKQVFGEVDEDGAVSGDVVPGGEGAKRPNGNTYLYDGGILSNRRTGSVQTSATKEWDASAFQAEFEDVTVVLTLQSRPAGVTPEAEWKDTGTTAELDDFYAEHLTVTHTASAPQYDALGRELEYRWVETGVYQGADSTQNLFQPDGNGGGTFTLQQSERIIEYRSTVQVDEESGHTTVTNTIANTIDYDVEKHWDTDGDGEYDTDKDLGSLPENMQITFALYRTISGQTLPEKAYVSFPMDGTEDAAPTVLQPGEANVTMQETAPWVAELTGLPEFDEEGRAYEYVLLESGAADYFPTYETTRDEEGNYRTDVYNAPGEGNRILVRKEWIDDSDIAHREPVTIQVYERATNAPVGNPVVLGEDGVWQQLVGIGTLETDAVYILETQVGGKDIPLQSYTLGSEQSPNYDPKAPDQDTAIQFAGAYHNYEATYLDKKIENEHCYIVMNRRLGRIDLNVTKKWIDGDRQATEELQAALAEKNMALALRLEFDCEVKEGYVIGTDSVTLGGQSLFIEDAAGNRAQSVQILLPEDGDLTESDKTQTLYFFNLPKYDTEGTSVTYTVEEIVVEKGEDGTWTEVEVVPKDIQDRLNQYSRTVGETKYEVGPNHAQDTASIDVTNRLQETKTVNWHKEWYDEYAYAGNLRPDIYLNIYKVEHDANGDPKTPEIYVRDYRWVYEAGTGTDQKSNWTAQISGLPRYDDYGYEILYYATEHTVIDWAAIDYAEVRYEFGGADIGSASDPVDETTHVVNVTILENTRAGERLYALQEDGTFVNRLENTVTIQGQKVWSSLPAGWNPANLPTVTFALYQSKAGSEDEKEIATLTVSDWTDWQNGTYVFEITHTGENTPGETEVPEGEQPLPKYDEKGNLYNYVLREVEMTWGGDGEKPDLENWGSVFTPTIQPGTYLATNTYAPDTGSLSFQKYLELPMGQKGPLSYPAVKFEITRTYTDNEGKTSDPEDVETVTWTSKEVEEAYTTCTGARSTPVQKVFTVEDLELYAPNGSPYVYTVTEVKDGFLEGYDTWAAEGDVALDALKEDGNRKESVGGLTPKQAASGQTAEPAATFLNARQTEETISLRGEKRWEDYGNALGTRPPDIVITLSRRANSQPGQNNPVPEETLPTDTYTITWTNEENSDTWVYNIQGKGETELEKYAPNGMPWIYIVTENPIGGYTTTPASGKVEKSAATAAADGVVTMPELVNSIQTDVPFSKEWAQQGDAPITEDYLGFKIAVTFELQVREKGTDDPWEDADAYGPFQSYIQDTQDGVFDGEYAFEKTLTGFINEKKSGSFKDLPLVIPGTGSSVISLEYRVVETQVKYGEQPYEVTIEDGDTYTVNPGAPFTLPAKIPGGDNNNAHTNRLETQDLTVTKIWEGDHGNAYGSRPDTDRTGYDWQVSFLIQQSSNDGTTWTHVQAHDEDAAEDLVVTLYGTNDQDTVSATISGLPKVDENGNRISYRAMELEDGYTPTDGAVSGEDLCDEGETFHGTYKVTYDASHTTATNTLEPTKVLALKEWNPGETDGQHPSVDLTLEYQVGKDAWEPLCTVTVNGEADTTTRPYYEYEPWHAVWEDLPVALPGSMLIDGKTQYRVVETVPDGYVQESAEKPSAENENTYTFTNVEAVDFTVTKYWHVEDPANEIQTVTVQLYRTTNAQEKNPDEDEKVATVDLAGNSSHTFRNLPKYNPDGKLYTYYARETSEWDGYDVYYSDEVDGTTIRNVGTTAIAVTKIWKDNGNAYGTRPEDLALTLQRKTDAETNWTTVTDVQQPVWTKNDNTWTCTYTGLPYADANGNRYTYRVTEAGLDREDMLPANEAAGPAHADSKYAPSYAPADGTAQEGKVQITNTLQEYIEIPVTKVWIDGGPDAGERPDSITFVLCADGVEVNRHTVPYTLASRIADLLTGGEGEWEYTFKTNAAGKRLPRYDAEGRKILYTVREEPVPDGYKGGQGEANDPDDASQGFTVRNEKVTQLTVTKVWHKVPVEEQLAVVVRLYRYTNDLNALEPGTSAALNAGNNWTYTFADLPQYEAETGAKYTYVAREVSIGGLPAEDLNYEITHTDGERPDGIFHTVYTTTIANVGRTDIPVTKTWLDNGNAYGTRPDTLTLTLYRRIEDGAEVVVREVTPPAESWTKVADTWIYTFADLPIADKDGHPYIYRVAETVPEGYIRSDDPQGDLTLTNTLYAQIDIPVTKTWVDNSDGWGERPESVTIALYRQSDLTARELVHTLTLKADGGFLEQVWDALTGRTDDDWTYTFTDLPKYDEYGALYTYTIEETLPPGYEDLYDVAYDQGNFTVTNTRAGDLRVEKEVTGSDGQRNRDFTFTVTLDDATIQGTYGDMTFENGVATFTLRHGQSATAEDLPAGLGYTVVEREANTNRYRTTYTGETGTIPAGDTAVAHVENRRNRQTYPDYTEEPTPTPEIPEEDWHWPHTPPHDGDWHDVPRTGDTMHLTPYLLLAALSAAGLAVLAAFALRRRRRR